MKALIVNAPREAVFAEVATPVPKGREVLIRVKRAGICGTDNAIFTGETSFVRDGLIRYPVRFGHEWSGVVEKVGDAVTAFRPGDRVIGDNGVSCGSCPACLERRYGDCPNSRAVGTVNCWDGCFAEYILMPDYHVYRLPESVSLDQGALIEPLSIAYDAFRGVPLGPESAVAVIGCGPIGLSAAALAKHYGAGRILMLGRRESKLQIAKELGATDAVNILETDAVRVVTDLTGGGADLVIETSGAESCLAQSIRMARKCGQVSVIGFYEKNVGGLPIDRLVLNCIRLQGAAGRYGNIEASRDILASGDINLMKMITHRVKFADCLDFFYNEAKTREERIKVMIEFEGETV